MAEASEVEHLKHKLLGKIVERHGPIETRCWIWVGAITDKGYGSIQWNKRMWGAHRLSYVTFVGPIPNHLNCLHHCDNPPCIRPSHLYVGTDQDNMDDMVRRGRQGYRPIGVDNHNAVLTEAEVSAIKFLALEGQLTLREIGSSYGVTHRVVRLIRDSLTWAHVQPIEPPPPLPTIRLWRRI